MRGFGKSRMFFKSGLLQSELKNQRRLLNHHGKEALALSAADMSALLVRRDTLRPSESRAETQPKLQPALLSLSAMIFPVLQLFKTTCGAGLLASSCALTFARALPARSPVSAIHQLGVKVAVSVIGPFIVIEAGLFGPE